MSGVSRGARSPSGSACRRSTVGAWLRRPPTFPRAHVPAVRRSRSRRPTAASGSARVEHWDEYRRQHRPPQTTAGWRERVHQLEAEIAQVRRAARRPRGGMTRSRPNSSASSPRAPADRTSTRLQAQLRSSGYCARPVRLRGQIETCDGHGRRRVWSTDTEPDGILRKACGNRREAVCPPCAERYRQDAYHLIAAGLRGGKGVPDTVAEHPALFVTLTAPSFGPVHTRRSAPDGRPRRCRPRRDAPVCEHGVRLSCARVHDEDDPCLGEPICPDCFDHRGRGPVEQRARRAVAAHRPIYLPRALARLTGMTQARLRELVRVAYVKVAEYQRRGLVHLHAVIRLDRAMPAYRAHEVHPPPAAVRRRAARGRAARHRGRGRRAAARTSSAAAACAGATSSTSAASTPRRGREVAGYLAKYATKSTEQAGGVLHRVTEHQVDELPVREHVRRYLRAAFTLAARSRARGPAARRVRAPARLPRPLPDQEPPLLDHVQGAARGARAARARADPRPLPRRRATRDRRRERADRELRVRRRRAISQLRTRSYAIRRAAGRASNGESGARSAAASRRGRTRIVRVVGGGRGGGARGRR